MTIKLDSKSKEILLQFQKIELTEHLIYEKLAKASTGNNKKILNRIAVEELHHHNIFKKYTGQEVGPSQMHIKKYLLYSKIFGIIFAIKLMEKDEANIQKDYSKIAKLIPEIKKISHEENEHEQQLISLIQEEKFGYLGSIVLGLNDALVELTGALAGFTLALQQTKLIALAGLIAGVAASFSMAASEYLSTKAEGHKNSLKAATYTGVAYIVTVLFLIFPFFILSSAFTALAATLVIGVLIIFFYTYFTSIARDQPFRRNFLEMICISLGIAALTFGFAYVLRGMMGF